MTPEHTAGQAHGQLAEIEATEIDLTDPSREEPQILYLNANQPNSPASPASSGATDTIDTDLEVTLDVSVTGELDANLEALQEELDHRHVATHGEHLWVDERLVCSPANGRFWKNPEEAVPERGEFLLAGEVVGHVVAPDGQPVAVKSPFAGWAMGFLIPNGSPVKTSEPVLWLRTL